MNKIYKPVNIFVEAWQVGSKEPMPAFLRNALNSGSVYYQGGVEPYLIIIHPGAVEVRAEKGDWILYSEVNGLAVYDDHSFKEDFEECG